MFLSTVCCCSHLQTLRHVRVKSNWLFSERLPLLLFACDVGFPGSASPGYTSMFSSMAPTPSIARCSRFKSSPSSLRADWHKQDWDTCDLQKQQFTAIHAAIESVGDHNSNLVSWQTTTTGEP